MGWTSQYFTTIIIEGNTPQTGIFIYNGVPALGTLIGSWAAAAGTDAFGNPYPTGINVTQGTLQSVSIISAILTSAIIQTSVISGSTLNSNTINQGTINETTIIFDSGGGMLFGYTSSTSSTTQTAAGTYNWTSPLTGTANVSVIGAGAGGDGGNASEGGNGGGGGGYGGEPNYAVNNAQVYSYTVGAGGGNSSTGGGHGGDGTDSFFDLGGQGVYASGGKGNGTAGIGLGNSVNFTGGTGGAVSGFTGGASGGNSANKSANGNNGLSSTSSTHAGAPAPQPGSGTGGAGGDAGSNASNGGSPGAGGGGAGAGGSNPTQQSISYAPLWNASYFGPDAAGGAPPNGRRSTSTMYQGGETSGGGSFNGNQRCVFAFNRTQIASDFAGYTVTGAQVQFKNLHSWYNSGMIIELDEFQGLPGSAPGSMPTSDFRSADASLNIAEGATTVFNVSTSIASRFTGGASNGLGMGFQVAANHPYNLSYYGYFDPSQTRFKITGTSGGTGLTNSGTGSDGSVVITTSSSSTLEFALAPQSGSDSSSNAYAAGYTGPLSAFQPGSSPTVVEGWHAITLVNGWQNGSDNSPQYIYRGNNVVEVIGSINGVHATATGFFVMPPGYIPPHNQVIGTATCIQVAGSTALPQATITCSSTGSLTINGPTVAQLNVAATAIWALNCFIRLDAPA